MRDLLKTQSELDQTYKKSKERSEKKNEEPFIDSEEMLKAWLEGSEIKEKN